MDPISFDGFLVLEVPKQEPTPWVKFLGCFDNIEEAKQHATRSQIERPESNIFIYNNKK